MKLEWRCVFWLGTGAFFLYLCVLYWPGVSHFLSALFHAAIPFAVGCVIMGVLGMLLAVPLTAVFYQLLREDVCKESFVI